MAFQELIGETATVGRTMSESSDQFPDFELDRASIRRFNDIGEIERFTNAIGDLPEAANALRDRPVQYVAQSGEVTPQAAPDLILNLHAGHGSEVAS